MKFKLMLVLCAILTSSYALASEDPREAKAEMTPRDKRSYAAGFDMGQTMKKAADMDTDSFRKGLKDGLSGNNTPGSDKEIKSSEAPNEKRSYAAGFDTGKTMKKAVDVDSATLEKGLQDGLSGDKALLSDEEIKSIAAKVKEEIRAKDPRKALGEKNKKEGEAFLANNKKKKGVTTLPDGLQYKVINEGKPSSPTKLKPVDTVRVNYRGARIDGTEFVTTYKFGKPVSMKVGGAVKGLQEALSLMNMGAKWQVFLPPDLAFGEQGAPNSSVGPEETVIFELELLLIKRGHKQLAD